MKVIRDALSAFPRKYHKKTLRHLLGDEKLNIIDVGATGGPHLRWKAIGSKAHFITFDPDPRAEVKKWQAKNFPFGLWSKEEQRDLNLASFPEASSLYPFHPNLHSFSNASCHSVVDTTKVDLKKLDQLVSNADILKVDAEGAELEILKGGGKLLKSSIFAVELEVSFLARHKGAPLFHEIDAYLRSIGFELHQIQRNHWLRKNAYHPIYSTPQLVCGNVLYLRKTEDLLKHDLRRVVTTLLIYNCHGLALELCPTKELKALVKRCSVSSSWYCVQLLLSILFGFSGVMMFCISKKMRLKFLEYTRDRIRALGHVMLSISKSGNCCIYDES